MRYLNRLLATAVVSGCASTPTFAQMGTIASGGGVTTGSLSGTGGLAGGTGGTGGTGGMGANGGMGASGNGANPSGTADSLSSGLSSMSGITAPGANSGGGTSVISASNFLSATYGNPYYQGLLSNAKSNVGPGGFGSVLFGASGGAGGGSIGYAAGGGTTGVGGRTALGGAGGRTGVGGLGGIGGRGGLGGGADPGGILVQLPIQITHPAIARFPVMPVATSQLQTDLAGMIARSNEISNPAGVSVSVERGIVTLSGTVRDIEEAKTIAGMIRLTPGVREVKNDLTFPKQ